MSDESWVFNWNKEEMLRALRLMPEFPDPDPPLMIMPSFEMGLNADILILSHHIRDYLKVGKGKSLNKNSLYPKLLTGMFPSLPVSIWKKIVAHTGYRNWYHLDGKKKAQMFLTVFQILESLSRFPSGLKEKIDAFAIEFCKGTSTTLRGENNE